MTFKNDVKTATAGGADVVLFTCPAGAEASVHTLFLDAQGGSGAATLKLTRQATGQTVTFLDGYALADDSPFTFPKPINMTPGDELSLSATGSDVVALVSAFQDGGTGSAASFNVRGAYDAAATYNTLDVVSQAGSSFIALNDGVTNDAPPSANWMVLSAKGEAGTDGTISASIAVTVANTGSGNHYFLDGGEQQLALLTPSVTYRFDQSDPSNTGHPLRFSATSDGTHGGGTEFTTGVVTSGTPGSAGAYTEITLEQDGPSVLYYYCSVHSGMGGTVNKTVSQTDLGTKVGQSSSTGSAILPAGTTAERDVSPVAGYLRYNSDENSFEGYDGTEWGAIGGAAATINQQFSKADADAVAWAKTGSGTAETQTAIWVEVDGSVQEIASGTSITMPTLTAGTDYAIWVAPDGSLEADTSFTTAPTIGGRKIGGFHYAPGGNATGTSGGNTTPQINEYSLWDLNWRPACPDPRGMALVGDGFWADIYLCGVDAITNGSSAYNVTIADGSSPPKIPSMFGGDGSTTYGSLTWFEAMELATAFGKRCMAQQEFMSAAYGTTEESAIGTDPGTTNWDAAYVSKWGLNQVTGCMYVWGRDRGGPDGGASWSANTEGRGSEYNAPNAGRFGGAWYSGSNAGSRCSRWNLAASGSLNGIGARFACDHLALE